MSRDKGTREIASFVLGAAHTWSQRSTTHEETLKDRNVLI